LKINVYSGTDTENGSTPLQIAVTVECPSAALTQQLIEARCSVDLQDGQGATPLHHAADGGHFLIAKLLIAASGRNVNLQDNSGCTPVHMAAQNGHASVLELLIAARCDVDLQNAVARNGPAGLSPLHLAVRYGMRLHVPAMRSEEGGTMRWNGSKSGIEAVIKQLIAARCNIDLQTKNGCTPLQIAAGEGQVGNVKQLIDARCNVDLWDERGCTALHAAAELTGNDAVTKQLIAARCNVDLQMKDGRTPLHIAAGKGHETVTEQLIAARCSVDLQEENGWTPLSVAAAKGNESVTSQLIAARCQLDLQANSGGTPLFTAVISGLQGHAAVTKQLIEARSNINLGVRLQQSYSGSGTLCAFQLPIA
jgi:serine/threonine-protein phosphatase 6 regulatory ankyrin repeat subunit B